MVWFGSFFTLMRHLVVKKICTSYLGLNDLLRPHFTIHAHNKKLASVSNVYVIWICYVKSNYIVMGMKKGKKNKRNCLFGLLKLDIMLWLRLQFNKVIASRRI